MGALGAAKNSIAPCVRIRYNRSVVITYYGGTCFRLQNGNSSVLVDPDTDRLKADLTLRTSGTIDALSHVASGGGAREVLCAGEYEVQGIEIQGIALDEESTEKTLRTAYVLTWDEISFAFLGSAGRVPAAHVLDALETAQVLFFSVAPRGGFSSENALKLVRQIEPAFVVPSYEKEVSGLLKVLGQKAAPEEKVVFKKKDLVSEKSRVVYLTNVRS